METKECPNCGKNMIESYARTQPLIYPPITQMEWFCACGHKEEGRTIRHPSQFESDMERWKEANK